MAMPVWYATGSRRRAFRCTLLSGLTEPVGAVLAFALLRPFLNGLLLGVLFGAVAGSWSISRWKSSSPPPGSTATTGRPCGPRCAASA